MPLHPVFRLWFLLLLGLCCFGSLISTTSAEQERVVLQLKWSHQFQFAGYYLAKEKGYYREAGLDVEIRAGSPQLNVTDAVLSGQADFGVGTSSLLIDYAEGKPVVVLGVIYQHSPLVLVMKSPKLSSTIEDIKNNRIMIESQSGDLLAMLHRAGLSLDELDIVERPEDALEQLENSNGASAISAYLTDEPYRLDQKGVRHITFTPRAYGVDFYGDNFFTTKAMLSEKPELVKGFREATIRGWKEALKNPEEAIDLIIKLYPDGKSREALRYEALITQDLATKLVEPGYMLSARWNHIADTYLETGMIKGKPDLEGFIYDVSPRKWPKWFWPSLLGVSVFVLFLVVITLYLKSLNRSLNREVALRRETEKDLQKLNRELHLAKEASEVANLEKTWFISNVSHDLKAPLSSIISLANIFKHHSESLKLPEKFNRFIKQLNSGSEFLMLMLNNILDHSMFEMDKVSLQPEWVSFDKCSSDIAGLAYPLASEKDVRIEVQNSSDQEYLFIDRVRFSQILLNLLHNAIKFSPRGGVVLLRLQLKDDVLNVEVHDQGPGISSEDQKKVFEMFTKAKKSPTHHEGTGLGLSIVQRNIELFNGTIRMAQAQPCGSVFYVSIPLKEDEVNPPTPMP